MLCKRWDRPCAGINRQDKRRGSDWKPSCRRSSRRYAVVCTSRYRRSGVAETCAGWTLPIFRRAGELGEFGVVSGADCTLLGPGLTPALTKGESLCRPAGSTFHTLAASSQGGASLPGAALRRHSSKVRAVCGNSAPTDPCGGCEATRIPTAKSFFCRLSRKAGRVTDDKAIVCPTGACKAEPFLENGRGPGGVS